MKDLIKEAKRFALIAHGDQKYGEHDYSYHLERVVTILSLHGVGDPELLAAAWLHDTAEDTAATLANIHEEFGDRVMCLVYAVTNEPGQNRAERNRKTYHKISAIKDAILVKLADRLANVRESLANNPGLYAMYRKEWPGFYAGLRGSVVSPTHRTVSEVLWGDLEDLIKGRSDVGIEDDSQRTRKSAHEDPSQGSA